MMKARFRICRTARLFCAAASLALSCAAFAGAGSAAARWLQLQSAPLFLRLCVSFSCGVLFLFAGLLLVTWLCGRFYCSLLCPLGLWQDLAGAVRPRSGSPLPPWRKSRYFLAALLFAAAAGGCSGGVLLLDPYANFGRLIRPLTAGGIAALVVITLLAVWKKRLFCSFLCPVGTWLGIVSRHSVLRLVIDGSCVRCGRCVSVCPAGCIDLAGGRIDPERCVRCLACLDGCPKGAIRWRLAAGPGTAEKPTSRRDFLRNGGVLLAGGLLGAALARSAKPLLRKMVPAGKILPPGAGSPERFAFHCTGCQLCAASCPAGIIVPAPGGFGPVTVDLKRGACRYGCNLCTQVCPTGALPKLTLAAKQHTPIGRAHFDPQHCLVFQTDEACGRCAEACPVHAVTLRRNGTPRPVNGSLCLGCGACRTVCPAPVKAYVITPPAA